MITQEQMNAAKATTQYSHPHILHQHDDCIRMAYEWLDAQKKTKRVSRFSMCLKHLIEEWCGRYISQSDVSVAAELHPDIEGQYPYFNISKQLTEPAMSRLEGIGEAMKHLQRNHHDYQRYHFHEDEDYKTLPGRHN